MCVYVCMCVCVCVSMWVSIVCIQCVGEGGKEVGMREEGVEMGILKLNTVHVILVEN